MRPAILFAAVLALCPGQWMIISRLHAPTLEQRRQQGGHIVEPYTEQFWQSTPALQLHTHLSIVRRENSVEVLKNSASLLICVLLGERLPRLRCLFSAIRLGGGSFRTTAPPLFSMV